MIFQLFASRPANPTIDALYGAIVAQARLPSFYLTYGVGDSVEGRFELLVLHLVLLFHRLAPQPEFAHTLGQSVFDRFCSDMDHNLREMGVGDLSVPKQMRRLAEAFYGRAGAYERALAADDAAGLASALAKNVFAETGSPSDEAVRLAAYVRQAVKELEQMDASAFAHGVLRFPDPDEVITPARSGERYE